MIQQYNKNIRNNIITISIQKYNNNTITITTIYNIKQQQ